MKPNSKNLEKLVKRIVRGEPISPGELLSQWGGLGPEGDLVVVLLLNRLKGWKAFAASAEIHPAVRAKLAEIIDSAGVTSEALDALSALGIEPRKEDGARIRALRILESVAGDHSGWETARETILQDAILRRAVLSMLENEPTQAAAEFISTLLDQNLPAQEDHEVRASLYRMKQKGVTVPQKVSATLVPDKELFAFADNPVPAWQVALCYRPHSVFSSGGDLYVLSYMEGFQSDPIRKEPNVQLDASNFQQLADRYGTQLESQIGVKLRFRPVTPSQARYFLRQTLEFMDKTGARPLQNFMKFIGNDPFEDPLESAEPFPPKDSPETVLLDHPYFSAWSMDPSQLSEYFASLKEAEQGSIILVGAPLLEKKHAAATGALNRYFTAQNRRMWGFLFRKAAFHLRQEDPDAGAAAWWIAKDLETLEKPADSIAAAAILMDRAVESQEKLDRKKAEEEKKSSLIVTPDEFSRDRRRRP